MVIDLYTKPSCVQCDATKRAFDKHGLEYRAIDLSVETSAIDDLREMGFQQVPVVVAGEQSWSGYRPDRIKNLVTLCQQDDEVSTTKLAVVNS